MTKVIIIDDEVHCCASLRENLSLVGGEHYTVIATCHNAEDGKKAIAHHKPDVVFLDVEMPGKSGFEMLDDIPAIDFDIIFTTAYSQYALQALKLSAVDYLLKPIGEADLEEALIKYQHKKDQKAFAEQVQMLVQFSKHQNTAKKIALPTASGLEFIPIDEIIRLEAQINYTVIHLLNNKKITIAKTLKEYEELLTVYGFCRVHNSHLINTKYVRRYTKGKGGSVTLDDGSVVDISRQRKEEFMRVFQEMGSL